MPDLTAIATAVKLAQDTSRPLQPLSAQFAGFDVPAAYRVAALVHEARVRDGARPVGRKIGFTNRDLWKIYGVAHPIWGYVYDTTVRFGGQALVCPIGRFLEPKVEPEIVVHFGSTPPAGGGLLAILGCIDWIAHGFEVVQSHFPGWRFEAADTIADGALHGTLLIGEPQPVETLGTDLLETLAALEIRLYRDDELCDVGCGANVLGSPLGAVAHLMSALAAPPPAIGLQAGELVTTGTVTAAHAILPGQVWRSEVRGLGLPGLVVRFEK